MGCLSSTTASNQEDQKVNLSNANSLRKIIFIGLEGGGKTSIIQYLKTGQFQDLNPTIGTKVETINTSHGNFIVFDMGGGFSLKEEWNHYFDNLDGLVFVIDSTKQENLEQIKEEIHQLVVKFQQKGVILIYFNKIDCQNCLDINWLLRETNLQTTESDVILQRCSAKTGQGVWEGMEKMNKLFDSHKKLM